jgi:hypothetical protein
LVVGAVTLLTTLCIGAAAIGKFAATFSFVAAVSLEPKSVSKTDTGAGVLGAGSGGGTGVVSLSIL